MKTLCARHGTSRGNRRRAGARQLGIRREKGTKAQRGKRPGAQGEKGRDQDQGHDQDHDYGDANAPIYCPDHPNQTSGYYANGVKLRSPGSRCAVRSLLTCAVPCEAFRRSMVALRSWRESIPNPVHPCSFSSPSIIPTFPYSITPAPLPSLTQVRHLRGKNGKNRWVDRRKTL